MSGTRRRRRRGHPKGKAWGFHGLRPAAKSNTSSATASSASAPSAPSESAPSAPSSS
jgi:hypothetical protein